MCREHKTKTEIEEELKAWKYIDHYFHELSDYYSENEEFDLASELLKGKIQDCKNVS